MGAIFSMKSKITFIMLMLCLTASVSSCAGKKLSQVYWQRIEDSSALYLTGPKAQQELEENIATCVHEIDELVILGAIRETTPPDTHSEYHQPLEASGDLDYYDTPTRLGSKKVAHSDFHDFESCMRSKGWERVRYVRYETDMKAQKTYRKTKHYRETGIMMDPEMRIKKIKKEEDDNYSSLND